MIEAIIVTWLLGITLIGIAQLRDEYRKGKSVAPRCRMGDL